MKWKQPSQPASTSQSKMICNTHTLGIPFPPAGTPATVPNIVKASRVKITEPAPIQLPGAGLNRAINYYADYGGCGHWRMIWPEYCLNIAQKAVVSGSSMMITDPRFYEQVKCVKLQRQATESQLSFVNHLKSNVCERTGMRLLYEIDDVVFKDDIPIFNRCRDAFDNDDIVRYINDIMNKVDEITVTCDYMREYYMDKTGHENVTVIPNYAPKFWSDRFYDETSLMERFTKHKKRPRVGYTGSGTHFDVMNRTNQQDDFTHVVDYIIKTRKKFEWVFMGGMPLRLKPFIDSGEILFVPWAPLNDYPKAISDLNVNLLIAPLQDNEFNRCKSNIKHLEGATQGIPVICQDMVTYDSCPTRFKTGSELIDQIDAVMSSEQSYQKISREAREYADGMWLEDHISEHWEAYFRNQDEPRPALARLNPRFRSK